MPYDPTGFVSHPDELHRGQAWKRPVRMASTGNLALSGLQTIDGVVGADGDRVLVKDNSTGSQNGIWVMASGAWTRAFDMDQDGTTAIPAEEVLGAVVYVITGTANGGTYWRVTNTATPTLGTTAITWAAFGGGAPTGAAGGDLSGSYPNPSVVDDSHGHSGSTITGVIETGDTAGGDLSGTYPNPSVVNDSHSHTAATLPAATGGELLISDTPSTPLIFADLIQNEAQDDLVYAD